MLFYFTGTGNSLYIAKQIEKKPLSIPQILKQEELEFSDKSIGIVAPIYGHELPYMVKEFIRKTKFNTDYFYLILTYGNRHGGASELAKAFCSLCHIKPNYINVIKMVDNWLPSFDMEEQRKIDKHINEHLRVIKEDIKSKKNYISEVNDEDRNAHLQFLNRMKNMPSDAWQHLIQITDQCIGCGICTKVCPSHSIKIVDHKALFTPGHCETCLACIHACPHFAIKLSSGEKNEHARYRHEDITLQEIIKSNY